MFHGTTRIIVNASSLSNNRFVTNSSLRGANGSRERAPDDRLRGEAIQLRYRIPFLDWRFREGWTSSHDATWLISTTFGEPKFLRKVGLGILPAAVRGRGSTNLISGGRLKRARFASKCAQVSASGALGPAFTPMKRTPV